MYKRISLLVALVLFEAAPALAQTVLLPEPQHPTTRVGTRAANFLNIGVGARARALGDAYAALADDVNALYWNTAGIVYLDGMSAAFSHAALYDDLDLDHTFVGVVMPTRIAHFGISLTSFNSGEILRTTIEFPEGGDPGFGGTFDWRAFAVGLHAATRITDRLAFGAAAKIIDEGMDGARASFVGADLGLLFHTGMYGITLGASLQNVGSSGRLSGSLMRNNIPASGTNQRIIDSQRLLRYEFLTRDNSLPTTFHFSLATELIGGAEALLRPDPMHGLQLVTNFADGSDSDLQPSLGLEYNWNRIFFARVGKRWMNEAQIERGFMDRASVGGGLSLPFGGSRRISVDYAFSSFGDLNHVQVLSTEIRF